MEGVVARNPYEPEFHQAVREVTDSVMPLVLDDTRYRDAKILERMSEPERVVSFRVVWEDDGGKVWLSYDAPDYLVQRHHLPAGLKGPLAGVEALVTAAAQ